MNRDITAILAPLVAVVLLAVVVTQTVSALRVSGAWGSAGKAAVVAPDDPYVLLDGRLGATGPEVSVAGMRNPFSYTATTAPTPVHATTPRKPTPPPPPPRPVLTAIVMDADPRAIIRWADREWTVRTGALFDEFRVLSITRDQVVLQRGQETLVLKRNSGEQP